MGKGKKKGSKEKDADKIKTEGILLLIHMLTWVGLQSVTLHHLTSNSLYTEGLL